MPKGVKKSVDYAASIEEIDKKISTNKEIINTLKKEKTKLLREQKNADKNKLLEIVSESGLTPEQLSELVSKIKK